MVEYGSKPQVRGALMGRNLLNDIEINKEGKRVAFRTRSHSRRLKRKMAPCADHERPSREPKPGEHENYLLSRHWSSKQETGDNSTSKLKSQREARPSGR